MLLVMNNNYKYQISCVHSFIATENIINLMQFNVNSKNCSLSLELMKTKTQRNRMSFVSVSELRGAQQIACLQFWNKTLLWSILRPIIRTQ